MNENRFVSALQWPLVFWVVADLYLFLISSNPVVRGYVFAAAPAFQALGLATGAWTGWLAARLAGGWPDALGAGLLVALVGGGGWVLLFGVVQDLGVRNLMGPGVMQFSMILLGAFAAQSVRESETDRP